MNTLENAWRWRPTGVGEPDVAVGTARDSSGCWAAAPGTVGTVVDTGMIVTTPLVVISPMLPIRSVKYRFLSEPTVMS